MRSLRGLFILEPESFGLIYGPRQQAEIASRIDLLAPPMTPAQSLARPDLLEQADVILSGWGGPLLDEAFLEAAPNLKAVFYGAGSMAGLLTDAVWRRRLVVTSAIVANGQPVAEYALATILFSLKHGWRVARQTRQQRRFVERDEAPGGYGSTVGLISLGTIARTLLCMLKPFDLKIIAYDPFLTPHEAEELGVEPVSLDALFRQADVVSLHAPSLAETVGMITGKHLDSMRPGSTFINTARGQLVRQPELVDVAARRPDLQFVLDVATPEPLPVDSPLYDLENVVLTPHIAGSVGNECRRMGQAMVAELDRFIAGEPLKWALTQESVQHSSHRPVTAVCSNTARPVAV